MTQDQFSSACGVRRRAQSTYENDERSPDSKYLEAANGIGVDVGYVLSERSRNERLKDSLEDEFREFGRAFAAILGIGDAELFQAGESVSSRMKDHNAALERSGLVNYEKWRTALNAEYLRAATPLVENSPKMREISANQLDTALLADVIEHVEVLLPNKEAVPAIKRAGVIAMLCRAFKASGKVDLSMVKDAVNLIVR